MTRFFWGLLLVVVALAGFAVNRLAPKGSEFSIVDIDLQWNGGSSRPALPAKSASAEGVEGLSTEFDLSAERPIPRSGCLDTRQIGGARVVALGAYEGGDPTSLAFAGESAEVGRIAVQARAVGPPLILVLTAYDPVIWDFGGFPANRVRAVLVYGHADQGIARLDPSVPVRFTTSKVGRTACGTANYAYKQSRELRALRNEVRAVLGVPLAAFHGSYSPDALHADGGPFQPLTSARLTRATIRASGALQEDGLLPGDQGLRQLLDQGAIRPTRPADWAAWERRSGMKVETGQDSFVVLRRVTLPRGMYGANSRIFIVPAEVPMPTDPGSHNRYYRLRDGTCLSCW